MTAVWQFLTTYIALVTWSFVIGYCVQPRPGAATARWW